MPRRDVLRILVCGLSGLIASGAAAATPDEATPSERVWLVRGDEVALVVAQPDWPRGFDRLRVEERALDRHGHWQVRTEHVVVPDAIREGHRRSGELELYRAEQSDALRTLRDVMLRAGWREPSELAIEWPTSTRSDAPTDEVSGAFTLAGVRLDLQFRSVGKRKRSLSVRRPATDRELTIREWRTHRITLSRDRLVVLDPARVSRAWVAPNGAWLYLEVDTVCPRHAEVAPHTSTWPLSVPRLLEELDLPALVLLPPGQS